MDKTTRKDLKTDRFAEEVTHSVEVLAAHRQEAIRYGIFAVVALAVIVGGFLFYRSRVAARQADLAGAFDVRQGVVGGAPQPGDPRPVFKTQVEKDAAIKKSFAEVAAKHSGSNEGSVAAYQLGVVAADAGNLDEAEKQFRAAAESGNAVFSSVAKHSLAQVLAAKGKPADAEKLLRELISSPTVLISKEQATFSLARVLKPADGRKLVEPLLKATDPTVARYAEQVISELPAN
ncbi:MAG: tetratricopeptide repeat protein [Bryobacteraceae bacterium]